MMSHSWQFLFIAGLALVLAWLVVSRLLLLLQLYCRVRIEALLKRAPRRLQRYLTSVARQYGETIEPDDFWTRILLSCVALIGCLLLPLPWWCKVIACVLPLLLLAHLRAKIKLRLRTFERQWPACLELLAMLLHAGMSFQAALHALTELESEAIPLQQFRWLYRQIQAGVDLEGALAEFQLRLPSVSVSSFSAAVVQARITGGTLADTLIAQAEQARVQQQLAAEKFAQEIGLKLLFPLVTCFFPVTFLLILGPIVIGFLTPEG